MASYEYKSLGDYKDLLFKLLLYSGEKSEDCENCSLDIYSYFEICTNYLDTHLSYIGEDEELAEEIQKKMRGKIEEIEDRIGFTYIEF